MSTRDSKILCGPLISVIVPCYNYGHFISDALESVLAQTYENWECIVVDDGSTDTTRAVVTRYESKDSRIKYIYQRNHGLATSRNLGISLSKGAYIQFLDADDQIESRKLEFQSNVLEDAEDIDIVYGSVRFFETTSMEEPSPHGDGDSGSNQLSGSGDAILRSLIQYNLMVVNAPLIRSSVAKSVGDFDGDVKGIEDWDYWIRCAAKGYHFQYCYSDQTDALVRFHPNSMSRDDRLMLSSTLRLRDKISRTIGSAELVRLNRLLTFDTAGLLGIEEVLKGSKLRGMQHLFRAALGSSKLRVRAKCFVCGSVAPFVSKERFKQIARNSIGHPVRRSLPVS
jgi:glycosyltransferase involved in cell wall biosynthesis